MGREEGGGGEKKYAKKKRIQWGNDDISLAVCMQLGMAQFFGLPTTSFSSISRQSGRNL